jgi:YebC/PmpR family DNA-binding regulatory protein
MSGHSKWSQIKRQKGANDARRGATFTRITREIAIAAREGGGDPDANYRLRLAMEKARSVNMPADNIKRAIERASGSGAADQYEEIIYEGYGPGGVAILVEAATDNRNRTAAEVRSIFAKSGGQLAGAGSVAWQFQPRGVVLATGNGLDSDDIALAAIDAGAEDVDVEGDPLEIVTEPGSLEAVRKALEEAGVSVESAEISMQPTNAVEVEATVVRQNMRLIETLEELEDVQRVTANFDLPEEILAEAASA